MQDYADAVGGQCVVHSSPGAGTEVMAVLPLSRPGAEHLETLEKEAPDGEADRDLPLVP